MNELLQWVAIIGLWLYVLKLKAAGTAGGVVAILLALNKAIDAVIERLSGKDKS